MAPVGNFLNGMAPEGAFLPEKCPKIMESTVGQLALSCITALAQAVATLIEWNGTRWRLFAGNARKVFNIKLLSIFDLKKCPKITESMQLH